MGLVNIVAAALIYWGLYLLTKCICERLDRIATALERTNREQS